MDGGISPISSRKTVPPAPDSNNPIFVAVAPVNAPFSCPNNSLLISSSVNPPQLKKTKGESFLKLRE